MVGSGDGEPCGVYFVNSLTVAISVASIATISRRGRLKHPKTRTRGSPNHRDHSLTSFWRFSMRFSRFAVTASALALATTGLLAQKPLVLLATITDPSGAEVNSIDPAEVVFTENGTSGTVVKVEPVAALIPKVQLLVDNGIGMPPTSLGDLRTALKGLLTALPPNVEVTFVTTAPQPRMLEKATTDRIKLLSAVDRLTPDSGTGKFVDSMFEAIDRITK